MSAAAAGGDSSCSRDVPLVNLPLTKLSAVLLGVESELLFSPRRSIAPPNLVRGSLAGRPAPRSAPVTRLYHAALCT